MRLTFIFVLTFLLFGCDPGHEITSTIENKSSRQVILISSDFGADKVTLGSGESKVLKHSGLGGCKYIKGQEYCPSTD